MAATLSFTLHPLRSLLASKQLAKEAAPSAPSEGEPHSADEEMIASWQRHSEAGAAIRAMSAHLHRERICVQSTSPTVRSDDAAPATEQAQLAARARIDV